MNDIDYSMLKFYKGEKENPYKAKLKSVEVDLSFLPPPQSMRYDYTIPADEIKRLAISSYFWFYEQGFNQQWRKYNNAEWHSFFLAEGDSYAVAFLKTLSEDAAAEHHPTDKKAVFEIWLKYLFTEKLYAEYGGENQREIDYFTIHPPVIVSI